MKERIALLCRALRAGQPAVTALVTGCRGATPRSPGALLVLTAEAVAGTVGGGQAEHDILAPAQEMLGSGPAVQQGWHQCLSAEELRHMGQEYGGEEEILLLRWTSQDLPLAEQMVLAMEQNADCSLQIEYKEGCWRGTLLPEAVTTAAARALYPEAAGGRAVLCIRRRACQSGAGTAAGRSGLFLRGAGRASRLYDPGAVPSSRNPLRCAAGACSRHSLFCRRQCHYHDEGASGGL